METLRRMFAWTAFDATPRGSAVRWFALLLIVILPGGLVVPICCGIYGAIRQTLSGNAAKATVDAAAVIQTEARP